MGRGFDADNPAYDDEDMPADDEVDNWSQDHDYHEEEYDEDYYDEDYYDEFVEDEDDDFDEGH